MRDELLKLKEAGPESGHSAAPTTAKPEAKAAPARKRILTGNLPGQWFAAGGELINVEQAERITLPEEGDEDGESVVVTIGGSDVTLEGDYAKEFMSQFGLAPHKAEIVVEEDDENGQQLPKNAAPIPEPLPFDDIPEGERTGAQKAARTRAIHAREAASKK